MTPGRYTGGFGGGAGAQRTASPGRFFFIIKQILGIVEQIIGWRLPNLGNPRSATVLGDPTELEEMDREPEKIPEEYLEPRLLCISV